MAVRITKHKNNKGPSGSGGTVYVPAEVARMVPDEARFEAELTEDGVLYRFVGMAADLPTPGRPALPSWIRAGR